MALRFIEVVCGGTQEKNCVKVHRDCMWWYAGIEWR